MFEVIRLRYKGRKWDDRGTRSDVARDHVLRDVSSNAAAHTLSIDYFTIGPKVFKRSLG